MVGVDKGEVEFAKDSVKFFIDIIAIEEQDVNLAVKATIANKMMVGRVIKGDLLEVEGGVEVEEEVGSGYIVGVRVCITAEEVGGVRIEETSFFNMGLDVSKSRDKPIIFACSREVNNSMKRGRNIWRFQKDGKVRWRICGENGDERCEVGLPHDHGASVRPNVLHGEVVVMHVLRVEVCVVLARERL